MNSTVNQLDVGNDMLKSATIYRNSEFNYVYVCYHCECSFTNISDTLSHVESHFDVKVDIVDDSLEFSRNEGAKIKSEIPDTQYHNHHNHECVLCSQTFNAEPQLIIHLMKDHANMTSLTCPQCSQNWINEAKFSTHLQQHIDGNDTTYNALIDNIMSRCELTDELEAGECPRTQFNIKFLNAAPDCFEQTSTNISDSEPDSDIESGAAKVLSSLLPEKSKEKYNKAYENLKKWCEVKSVKKVNEKVLLAYFSSDEQRFKPSTAWSTYSMLNATLNIHDNINISDYGNLRAFLKRNSSGYEAKKSKVFTKEQAFRFIKEAPNVDFLAMKVALIVGLYGACRRDELVKMSLNDIEYLDIGIKITIPTTKYKKIRQFLIDEGDDSEVNLIHIFKKYVHLRPDNSETNRFFVGYRKGKCIRQPIGINTFGSYPQKIAAYLKLPFASEYTGHCFRRSSVGFLSHPRVTFPIVIRTDENFLKKKRKIADQIPSTKILKTEQGSSSKVIKIEQIIDSDSFDSIQCPDSNDPFDSIENIRSSIADSANQSTVAQFSVTESSPLSDSEFN